MWCLIIGALFLLLFLLWVLSDADLTLTIASWIGKTPDAYFESKVVWIVGASSGIGEALAHRLAKCKCKLILSARRTAQLENVRLACLEKSWDIKDADILVHPMDLTDLDSLKENANKAFTAFGQLDVIILNAGRSQRAEWEAVEPSVDFACFELNALAPTVLSRALLPKVLEQPNGAHFVVVSSLAGVIGAPFSPSYAAAKHALNGYFRCLSQEYGSRNIKVTITCPGSTFSPNNVLNAFTSTKNESHGELLTRPSSGHMTTERAADLICISAANDLAETWFTRIWAIRLLANMAVCYPLLPKKILQLVGPARLRKMREAK